MPIAVFLSKQTKGGRSMSLGISKPRLNVESLDVGLDAVLHAKGSKSYEGESNMKYSNEMSPSEQDQAKQKIKALKIQLECQLILNQVRRNQQFEQLQLNFEQAAIQCFERLAKMKSNSLSNNVQKYEFLKVMQHEKQSSDNLPQSEEMEQAEHSDQHQHINQFQDLILQSQPVRPPTDENKEMLDLIMALEYVHILIGKELEYQVPSPSNPVLVYNVLKWLSQLHELQRDELTWMVVMKYVFGCTPFIAKQVLEFQEKEYYFQTFLQQQLGNYNQENHQGDSPINQYLELMVKTVINQQLNLEQQLITQDFNVLDKKLSLENQQSMIEQLRHEASKQQSINIYKQTLGYNMLVAQLKFKVITNEGEEIIIIIPFDTNGLAIKVEQLHQKIVLSYAEIGEECYGHSIFKETSSRHSEYNLIVALSLECDKVRNSSQIKNTLQETSHFFNLLRDRFRKASTLPFKQIDQITIQIATSKQICTTCQIFLNNPHTKIAMAIQEFCISQQLVLNVNPVVTLNKSTICICTEENLNDKETNDKQAKLQYVKIEPKPQGIFSQEMICARYLQLDVLPNMNYLKVPFAEMQLKHTIIFNGHSISPKQYKYLIDLQIIVRKQNLKKQQRKWNLNRNIKKEANSVKNAKKNKKQRSQQPILKQSIQSDVLTEVKATVDNSTVQIINKTKQ